MKTLRQLTDLRGKKVFLRADFDVPVSAKGQIEEPFRIKKQKETLDYLVNQGARVIVAAHISDKSVGESFASLIPQLHMLLGHEINFLKNVSEIGAYFQSYAGSALLENIRQNEGEIKNDPEFAKQLASEFDVYVNNAFATSHRDHVSLSALAKLLPSYAGFVVEEETVQLSRIINSPKEGKVVVIGGAKAESKIPVIRNFLGKADKILIGGVVANDILKEMGRDIGSSVVDQNSSELLSGLDLSSPQLVIPKDFNISDNKILDIGPQSIQEFSEIIRNSKMIIWNGPMGLFENPDFARATKDIANAIINSGAEKIIGGGDTITAVNNLGLLNKFDFVSTGGGAMLTFLAGQSMPGLAALGWSKD